MADDKPKKENSRGRSKAANRSGTRTAANKARAAETRARRLRRASERKTSTDFIVPMDAMIPFGELPRKQQIAMMEDYASRGEIHPEFVPDPKRGMSVRGKKCGDAVTRRVEQFQKITKKRRQRKNFSKLGWKEKREHREAGREHRLPRNI